jgi:5-formyltetrahydrofolate cyclo-ligase
MTPTSAKRSLRLQAEAARRSLSEAAPDAGLRIAAHFAAAIALPPSAVIGGYLPTRYEADPVPLMEASRGRGHGIALPRVTGKARALSFHLWAGRPPMAGAYGLLEPEPDWPEALPDVFLVPLLACDAAGYRLGYGGGYYDRTLRAARAQRAILAVGIGFAGQVVSELTREPTDEPLDWMVTEEGARAFRKPAD